MAMIEKYLYLQKNLINLLHSGPSTLTLYICIQVIPEIRNLQWRPLTPTQPSLPIDAVAVWPWRRRRVAMTPSPLIFSPPSSALSSFPAHGVASSFSIPIALRRKAWIHRRFPRWRCDAGTLLPTFKPKVKLLVHACSLPTINDAHHKMLQERPQPIRQNGKHTLMPSWKEKKKLFIRCIISCFDTILYGTFHKSNFTPTLACHRKKLQVIQWFPNPVY